MKLLWKASLPAEGGASVQWGLPGVLDSTYLGKLKYTHQVVKENLLRIWAPAWLRCGLDKDEVFTISAKAAEQRNLNTEGSPLDYSLTTAGLLGFLLSLTGKRAHTDRQRGKACLRQLLGHLLAGSEAADLMGGAADEEVLAACPDRQPLSTCPCLGKLLDEHAAAAGPPQAKLASLLLTLFVSASCLASLAMLRRLLQSVCAAIELVVEDRLSSDALTYGHPGWNAAGAKRRRTDVSFRSALCVDAVRQGMGQTPAQIARARGNIAPQTVRNLTTAEVSGYRAALFFILRKVQHLSLAFDGKRLGQPAKETICIAGWEPIHRYGFWLPHQVLS